MNELLGWGQLLSGATICDQANANFKSRGPLIRCAFANCKRVPRQRRGEAEQGKKPRAQRRSQARFQCKNRFGENLSWPNLTPELRRTALRNGGVLHASTQAEPRSGLGLNELLGWGQLLSGATICNQANANFKSRRTLIRCAFADCKRVPRQKFEQAEQDKKPKTRRRSQAHCQCKSRFGETLPWPNLTPELSRAA